MTTKGNYSTLSGPVIFLHWREWLKAKRVETSWSLVPIVEQMETKCSKK